MAFQKSAFIFLLTGLLIVSTLILSGPPLLAASTPVIFQKTWGGNHYDYGAGVATDPSGNNYLTGYTCSFGSNSPRYCSLFITKFDSSGNLQWQRTWGGNLEDEATSIAVDTSGNSYITGYTESFGRGNGCGLACADLILLKFDPSGSLVWQRTWGSNSSETGRSVALDSTGNIFVVDRSYLLKFDASGGLLWQRTFNATVYAVTADSSGNAYLAGYVSIDGNGEVVLIKFDSAGNLQWLKTWGGRSYEVANSIALDAQGNIYLAGYTASFGAASDDAFILKFDSSGGLLWQRTWGGGSSDDAYGIAVDFSGNVDVTGTSSSFGSNDDVFLLQLNTSGTLLWQGVWGGPSREGGRGIAVDSSGNAVVAGFELGSLPYNVSSTPGAFLGSPSFLAQIPSLNVTTPTYSTATPGGILSTPQGSTIYAGSWDAFLFKYSFTAPGQPPGTGTPAAASEFTLELLAVITGIAAATSISVMSAGYFILKHRRK